MIRETAIKGVLILQPEVHKDKRGYFFDSYCKQNLEKVGIDINFLRDSETLSLKGTLRGLHYELAPYTQAKIVRVVRGRVLDVIVDIRKGSPTFGKWIKNELSQDNKRILFIPRGFAHGYLALSNRALLLYKFEKLYSAKHQAGIIYNDKILNIDWGYTIKKLIISKRDKLHPTFEKAKINFHYGRI